MSYNPKSSAEDNFREAFERLKRGKPTRMPLGTPVTQNNVAKEAGKRDPSALRLERYPDLIRDIKVWIDSQRTDTAPSARQQAEALRKKRGDLRTRQLEITAQRDIALSLLLSADDQVLHLMKELEDRQETKVTHLPLGRRTV